MFDEGSKALELVLTHASAYVIACKANHLLDPPTKVHKGALNKWSITSAESAQALVATGNTAWPCHISSISLDTLPRTWFTSHDQLCSQFAV